MAPAGERAAGAGPLVPGPGRPRARDPLRGLRPGGERGLRERRDGREHRHVRRRVAALVVGPRRPGRLPGRAAAAGDLRRGLVERHPEPGLEEGARGIRGGDGAGGHRLPLPARHLEVEQDRAPAVLPGQPRLAGPAPDRLRRRRQHDQRDHHQNRADRHRHPGPAALPRRAGDHRRRDQGHPGPVLKPPRLPRRLELHRPALPPPRPGAGTGTGPARPRPPGRPEPPRPHRHRPRRPDRLGAIPRRPGRRPRRPLAHAPPARVPAQTHRRRPLHRCPHHGLPGHIPAGPRPVPGRLPHRPLQGAQARHPGRRRRPAPAGGTASSGTAADPRRVPRLRRSPRHQPEHPRTRKSTHCPRSHATDPRHTANSPYFRTLT